MRRVVEVVDAIVAEGAIPSVSVAVWIAGREALHHTAGHARLVPTPIVAAPDQAYDLASVTKVLAGATLAAEHLARGTWRLDDPVRRWVSGVDERFVLWHLLAHASGLPAWAPLFERVPRADWGTEAARAAILDAAVATPPEVEPGTRHTYSDLGYLVLARALEAVGGPLPDQLGAVLARAGLPADTFRWGWPGAAATEDCPVRGRVVEGEVHDLNTCAMGGVSTHAGLFSTARALAAFGSASLDAWGGAGGLPRPAWDAPRVGTHRGGWDGISAGASSTGTAWPADGVGHLGYTGTSLWLAPRAHVSVAVLTNRVHPRDGKAAIRAARPRIHDAVATALGWRV